MYLVTNILVINAFIFVVYLLTIYLMQVGLTKPGRFDFVFTPVHGSWLNMIEMFFSKITRSLLRHMRVESKQELIQRIYQGMEEINNDPVIFRWTYKMQDAAII